MTERQRRFVDEYLRNGNAAEAYVRAGFSPRGADAGAARLLGNVSISDAIDHKRRQMELTAGIERKHILGILLGVATKSDTDASKVAACRQISRMLGYDAPIEAQMDTRLEVVLRKEY